MDVIVLLVLQKITMKNKLFLWKCFEVRLKLNDSYQSPNTGDPIVTYNSSYEL